MKEWTSSELKRMKNVLIQISKINSLKIDLKSIDKKQYAEHVIAGINRLNNLANYFFTKGRDAYRIDEIEANTINGNKTLDQIKNIILYLGVDTVNKIYSKISIPFFVNKTIRNIEKERKDLETQLLENEKQNKISKVERKEAKLQKALKNRNKKARKLLKKLKKYKLFRAKILKKKAFLSEQKKDIIKEYEIENENEKTKN